MAQSIVAVQVSSDDPRSVRGLQVLQTADTWIKCYRKPDHKPAFIVPSSNGKTSYLVDCRQCSCPDYQRHEMACKHTLAVRMWAAQKRAEMAAKEHKNQAARERRQQQRERASEPTPAASATITRPYSTYFPDA